MPTPPNSAADSGRSSDGLPSQPGPDNSVSPVDLKVKIAEQRLVVDWKDGAQTSHSFQALRHVCPCATCKTERESRSENPLHILKADPTGLKVVGAKLVGNYAIQFTWSDGHDTGIFDFRFIRSMDAS